MIWSDRTIDPSTATDKDTRRSPLVRRLLPLAGAVAALSLIVIPAAAQAEPNGDVTVFRCTYKVLTNPPTYKYVPPGTKITDVNGTRWVCGPDGNWFRDYSRIRVTETMLLAPPALAG
jgi:hypothetical protein